LDDGLGVVGGEYDVSGYGTGLPKDAFPGKDLAVIGDDVVRTQGSQLPQLRLRVLVLKGPPSFGSYLVIDQP
jgi:hypothetical protein